MEERDMEFPALTDISAGIAKVNKAADDIATAESRQTAGFEKLRHSLVQLYGRWIEVRLDGNEMRANRQVMRQSSLREGRASVDGVEWLKQAYIRPAGCLDIPDSLDFLYRGQVMVIGFDADRPYLGLRGVEEWVSYRLAKIYLDEVVELRRLDVEYAIHEPATVGS